MAFTVFLTREDRDTGIIRTLDNPVYLTKYEARQLYTIDREGVIQIFPVEASDFEFKLALNRKDYGEVLRIIQTSSLVGQSIIGYLRKKGYAEVALHFVKDPATRFELALESGHLQAASEAAAALESPAMWQVLADKAMQLGDIVIAEMAFQKLKAFHRLDLLYLCTGQPEKLEKMKKISGMRHDQQSRLLEALWTGDYADIVQLLANANSSHSVLIFAFEDQRIDIVKRRPGVHHGENIWL